jgi:hypothetical protein
MSQSSPAPLSGAAPSQAGAAPPDPSQDGGGFVVCVAAQADGSFQVYAQDSDQDPTDQSQGGEGGDGSQVQTADNVDDALAIAKQLIEQESGGSDDDSGQDGNAPLSPTDASSVWNQMAAKKDKSRAMGQ